MPCWTRPEQPKTTTPPVADRVKLPGSATGQRGKQDQGGTAEPKLGVGGDVSGRPAGPDRPASAGRPGWQPAPGRGWRPAQCPARLEPVDCRRVGIAVGTAYI